MDADEYLPFSYIYLLEQYSIPKFNLIRVGNSWGLQPILNQLEKDKLAPYQHNIYPDISLFI